MTIPKTGPKDTKNKPDLSLIPFGLIAEYLTPAYMEGLIKYYRESWKLGFTTSTMFAGCMRHLTAYIDGENYDPEAAKLGVNKHHLAGAIFCIICMLDTFKNHQELDDRGKDYKPEGWNSGMMTKQIKDQLERLEPKDMTCAFITQCTNPGADCYSGGRVCYITQDSLDIINRSAKEMKKSAGL